MGEPLDIANAAVWLGSDESRWVTGTVIPLDGGLSSYLPMPRAPPVTAASAPALALGATG